MDAKVHIMARISDTRSASAPPLGAIDQILLDGEPGVSPDALKGLFRDQPSGVAVVTADPGTGPVAMTASSLFSISVAPPLLVFSASAMSSSTPALLAADTVVVHLIDADSHDVAVLGATSGIDRFANPDQWDRLPTGEPYYTAPRRRLRGRVVRKDDAGAATLFIVHVIESWHEGAEADRPLVYHNRDWHVLGEGSLLS